MSMREFLSLYQRVCQICLAPVSRTGAGGERGNSLRVDTDQPGHAPREQECLSPHSSGPSALPCAGGFPLYRPWNQAMPPVRRGATAAPTFKHASSNPKYATNSKSGPRQARLAPKRHCRWRLCRVTTILRILICGPQKPASDKQNAPCRPTVRRPLRIHSDTGRATTKNNVMLISVVIGL